MNEPRPWDGGHEQLHVGPEPGLLGRVAADDAHPQLRACGRHPRTGGVGVEGVRGRCGSGPGRRPGEGPARCRPGAAGGPARGSAGHGPARPRPCSRGGGHTGRALGARRRAGSRRRLRSGAGGSCRGLAGRPLAGRHHLVPGPARAAGAHERAHGRGQEHHRRGRGQDHGRGAAPPAWRQRGLDPPAQAAGQGGGPHRQGRAEALVQARGEWTGRVEPRQGVVPGGPGSRPRCPGDEGGLQRLAQ